MKSESTPYITHIRKMCWIVLVKNEPTLFAIQSINIGPRECGERKWFFTPPSSSSRPTGRRKWLSSGTMISDPSIDRFIRLQSPLFNVGQCHKQILWAKLEVHKVDNINRISRFLGVSVSPASASLSLEDFAHCIRIVGDKTTYSRRMVTL